MNLFMIPYIAYMAFQFLSEISELQTRGFVPEQPSWPFPEYHDRKFNASSNQIYTEN